MNLNDSNQYKVVVFKRKFYYAVPRLMTLRDVFMDLTKDGSTPIRGIQDILLIESSAYDKMMSQNNTGVFKRDDFASIASHRFTVRGYQKLTKAA